MVKVKPVAGRHLSTEPASVPREAALLLKVLELGLREEADGLLKPVSVVVERLRKKRFKPTDGVVAEPNQLADGTTA